MMNYPIRTPRRHPRSSLRNIATRAAVAYGTYKVASWAWSKWNGLGDKDQSGSRQNKNDITASCQTSAPTSTFGRNTSRKRRNFMRKRKRSIHNCYFESMNALEKFMYSLRQSIESQTDYSHETKRLKQLRKKNKDEMSVIEQEKLWKVIKIKSMTRIIATLYVNTMLLLLLTVQIHVLGGCMFHESQNNEDEDESTSVTTATAAAAVATADDDNDVQQNHLVTKDTHIAVLMQTYNFFFESGILKLLEKVKLAVEKATESWITIEEPNELGIISSHDFTTAIHIVRSIENEGIILDFVFPSRKNDESQRGLEKSLIDETFDIMESPVFDEAIRDCLQTSFQVLESQLQSHLFNGNDTIHLVHVFGKLKKITNNFYEKPQSFNEEQIICWDEQIHFPNIFVQAMDRLESLKELGDVSFN